MAAAVAPVREPSERLGDVSTQAAFGAQSSGWGSRADASARVIFPGRFTGVVFGVVAIGLSLAVTGELVLLARKGFVGTALLAEMILSCICLRRVVGRPVPIVTTF